MKLAPENSNIDVEEVESFLQNVFQYLYPKVIRADYVDLATGNIELPNDHAQRELQLLEKCATLRGIEMNFVEEFQNVVLINDFGTTPMEDTGFWDFWDGLKIQERALIIKELETWKNRSRGIPLSDIPIEEQWFQFRHYIYKLLKDE